MGLMDYFRTGEATAQAEIYPTATVEMVGLMSVKTWAKQTGLKSVTKLHTSTFMDGTVKVKDGQLVTATVNMPRDNIDVLEASVDFFTSDEDGNMIPLESNNPKEDLTLCSPDVVSDFFAIRGCAVMKYHYTEDEYSQVSILFTIFLCLNDG